MARSRVDEEGNLKEGEGRSFVGKMGKVVERVREELGEGEQAKPIVGVCVSDGIRTEFLTGIEKRIFVREMRGEGRRWAGPRGRELENGARGGNSGRGKWVRWGERAAGGRNRKFAGEAEDRAAGSASEGFRVAGWGGASVAGGREWGRRQEIDGEV